MSEHLFKLGERTSLSAEDYDRVFAYACDWFMREHYGVTDDNVHTSVTAREWANELLTHLGLEMAQ